MIERKKLLNLSVIQTFFRAKTFLFYETRAMAPPKGRNPETTLWIYLESISYLSKTEQFVNKQVTSPISDPCTSNLLALPHLWSPWQRLQPSIPCGGSFSSVSVFSLRWPSSPSVCSPIINLRLISGLSCSPPYCFYPIMPTHTSSSLSLLQGC